MDDTAMPRFPAASSAHLRRLLYALIGAVVLASGVQGQDRIFVTWEPRHSLRGLAETYLRDPNAWTEILRANGLESAHELQSGMRLEIPVAANLGLAHTLGELRALIYQATKAGAQVFASEAISLANARHADALDGRGRGAMVGAMEAAEHGIAAARRALDISLQNRAVPAEAVLEGAGGRVQRRRPTEFDWTAVAVKALFEEQERLRTLSGSFALVRFRDASSLRLDENAQLAIRRMRHDRLTRHEQINVVLYGGGLRALIDPQAGREAVHVEVAGIDTRVRSRNYWMKATRDDTRLANYDGEIEVSARGSTVIVGENQGTLVKSDAAPEVPVDLLAAPSLLRPKDDRIINDTGVDLAWEANEKAQLYWLEVARDDQFKQLLFNGTEIERNGYYLPIAEEGLYYWRVSAVDAAGLPGPPSDRRRFRISLDSIPPFLLVTTPLDGQQVRDGIVGVSGRTEPGASLSLNGDPISVQQDGRFASELVLDEGANNLLLEARDPAGNVSREERTLSFLPPSTWFLRFAEGMARDDQARLVVDRPLIALKGTTLAGTSVRIGAIDASGFEANTVADEGGFFRFTLPVRAGVSEFVIDAVGPAGQRDEQRFAVVLDTVPPEIYLESQPPSRTASPMLTLSGRVEGGTAMALGNHPASVTLEGRFALDIPLESGANVVSLTARDLAGNRAEWQQTVVLDQEPPELLAYRVFHEQGTRGRTLVVEIEAQDASGLTAGIPYVLEVGKSIRSGVARRCVDGRCYRDRIALPTATPGQARLLSVTPQDYLGNRKEIQLE